MVGEWAEAATELEYGLHLGQAQGQRISVNQSRAYQSLMATARGDLARARGTLVDVEHQIVGEHPSYGAEMVAFATSMLAEAEGDVARPSSQLKSHPSIGAASASAMRSSNDVSIPTMLASGARRVARAEWQVTDGLDKSAARFGDSPPITGQIARRPSAASATSG